MTQKSKKEESFQKAEVNSDRYYRSPKEERSFWHMGIRDHKSSFSGTVRREAKLQSQSHEWVIKSNYSRSGAKKRKSYLHKRIEGEVQLKNGVYHINSTPPHYGGVQTSILLEKKRRKKRMVVFCCCFFKLGKT